MSPAWLGVAELCHVKSPFPVLFAVAFGPNIQKKLLVTVQALLFICLLAGLYGCKFNRCMAAHALDCGRCGIHANQAFGLSEQRGVRMDAHVLRYSGTI